jgi:hypothetical protein
MPLYSAANTGPPPGWTPQGTGIQASTPASYATAGTGPGMPSWMGGQTPGGVPNSSSPAIWAGISGQGNPFGPPPGTTAPPGYTPTPTGAGGVNGQPPPAGWNGGPPPGLQGMAAMGAGGPPQQFSPMIQQALGQGGQSGFSPQIQAAIAAAAARPNPTPYQGPPIAPGGVQPPNMSQNSPWAMKKQAVPGLSLNSNPLMNWGRQ